MRLTLYIAHKDFPGRWVGVWMDGWVGGWLENEFLKKTPSPKLDLSPCLGLSTLEFVNLLQVRWE